ncbi:hypothetical protein FA95DRAFT_1578667 [Auriscalpium vulgare]|uniref:Uncharacterized protein n=1 Tax=Auriscalpium vulgare TaxID=40419 RepID=A0ACB8R1D4_9AGAM|nr:hypothetical protein FA95DRAFT_1578667 [Auriscalpium vulgare]
MAGMTRSSTSTPCMDTAAHELGILVFLAALVPFRLTHFECDRLTRDSIMSNAHTRTGYQRVKNVGGLANHVVFSEEIKELQAQVEEKERMLHVYKAHLVLLRRTQNLSHRTACDGFVVFANPFIRISLHKSSIRPTEIMGPDADDIIRILFFHFPVELAYILAPTMINARTIFSLLAHVGCMAFIWQHYLATQRRAQISGCTKNFILNAVMAAARMDDFLDTSSNYPFRSKDRHNFHWFSAVIEKYSAPLMAVVCFSRPIDWDRWGIRRWWRFTNRIIAPTLLKTFSKPNDATLIRQDIVSEAQHYSSHVVRTSTTSTHSQVVMNVFASRLRDAAHAFITGSFLVPLRNHLRLRSGRTPATNSYTDVVRTLRWLSRPSHHPFPSQTLCQQLTSGRSIIRLDICLMRHILAVSKMLSKWDVIASFSATAAAIWHIPLLRRFVETKSYSLRYDVEISPTLFSRFLIAASVFSSGYYSIQICRSLSRLQTHVFSYLLVVLASYLTVQIVLESEVQRAWLGVGFFGIDWHASS